MSSKAVIYHSHGQPSEVLEVTELDPGVPQAGEVLVSRVIAPINPADLNAIEGTYPARPRSFPAVPGVEGVGIIEGVGPGVDPSWATGQAVVFPHVYGTWREAGVIAADSLIAVPQGVDLREAAMLKINPATAWRMLHDFVTPHPGGWVVQNAANSAVGRHVIAFAKEIGLKTINLVRRPELIGELEAAGGDLVFLDDANVKSAIASATGGAPIRLGLNAVGGESGTRLCTLLSEGGTLVTYGAMSRQAMKVPAGPLIFKDVALRGFWVSKWYERATSDEVNAMFNRLFGFIRKGIIQTKVEKVYPMAQALEAIARAQEGGRDGKILLGS